MINLLSKECNSMCAQSCDTMFYFALSGLKVLLRLDTQGVALGWSILPFQG